MSFLLDTDICSASMKGHPAVSNRFVQYGGRLHMSTVTLGELLARALRAKASPKRLQSLRNLLKEVQPLPVDESVAGKFGEVRSWQLDRGLSSPDLDLLNASAAPGPQADDGNAQHTGLCQHPWFDARGLDGSLIWPAC
jgi:predicted nucleic acid-binding protein